MTDYRSFAGLATVETHRRSTERAGTVCAVVDGADWQQKVIDLHRPDAVRILDWRHGAEHLAKAGQAPFGAGTAALSEWLGAGLHQLKHGEPELARQRLGTTYPIASGRMSVAFASQLLREFFGADTFHHSGVVNLKFLRPVKEGDTVNISGAYNSAQETPEGTLVTVDIACEDQNGDKTAIGQGSAIVA